MMMASPAVKPAVSSNANQRDPTGADVKVRFRVTVGAPSRVASATRATPQQRGREALRLLFQQRSRKKKPLALSPSRNLQSIRRSSQKLRRAASPWLLVNIPVRRGNGRTPQCVSQTQSMVPQVLAFKESEVASSNIWQGHQPTTIAPLETVGNRLCCCVRADRYHCHATRASAPTGRPPQKQMT